MKSIKLIAIIGILALWAPAAQATLVYDGSRVSTDANQITTAGSYGSAGNGFKIAWHITEDTAGSPFHYEYTLSGAGGGALAATLSHWILEVSDLATRSDFFNFNGLTPYAGQYVPATWPTGTANQGMPSDIYGIKFNSDTDYVKAGTQIYTLSFDTLRMPVWGDCFAKDVGGSSNYAYNTGFGTDPGSDTKDFNPWILVPDTKTAAVPIPGNVLPLGSGLVGLGLLRLRRRQHKS